MLRRFLILVFRHQISAILVMFGVLMALGGISKAVEVIGLLDRAITLPGVIDKIDIRPPASGTGKESFVPLIAFTDPSGARRTFEGPAGDSSTLDSKDKTVSVLYDPAKLQEPQLKLPSLQQGGEALLFLVIASGLTGIAALIAFWPRDLSQYFRDRAFDEQRFAPVSGLLAGADYIKQDRYPLELCELTAYMAALAYHEPTSVKSYPLTIEQHFAAHCPGFTHVATFSADETEGFGFVHDGAAYIIMRGTMGWADWRRNLRAWYTAPEESLPAGWTGPARHAGFAEGWHVIRDQVESWVKSTPYAKDPQFPFVFAGHSLGGALSFLGAWEFARRDRKVAAVITFGAARPGGDAFKADYERLGLADRTLRLEFDKDVVPIAQQLVGYAAVGKEWKQDRAPLLSEKTAAAAILLSWMIQLLWNNLLVKQIEKMKAQKAEPADGSQTPDPAGARGGAGPTAGVANLAGSGAAQAVAPEAGAAAKEPSPSLFELVRMNYKRWPQILGKLAVIVVFFGVLALAAHKMQKRYALALTTLSYNRIRSQLATTLAGTGIAMPEEDLHRHAYEALEHHLVAMRGSRPAEPGPYSELHNLPNRIASKSDLEWLNTFHGSRIW